MTTIDYSEVQRFKRWWVWLAVVALNILFLYAIVQQVILGKPFGEKPAPDYILLIVEFFMLLLILFLVSIRLKTRITESGIFYRFYPFQFNETAIEWHELRSAYIRQYNSFYEYGGWGIRPGTVKTGRAINTSASCNMGLQLQFSNGELLLIGTKRPDEIQLIIETLTASGKINSGI